MGDGYKNDYPDYNKVVENLRDYIKKAKRKLREVKERVEVDQKEEERSEKTREKKEREVVLECECDFYFATDGLRIALEKGGFILKGFTFSGFDPPEHLSKDGRSVTVGGLKWFSKGNFISINIGELNFAKKYCGKKAENIKVPVTLTKRIYLCE